MKTFVISLLLFLISVSVSMDQAHEARAFWVVRDCLTSEESISKMVEQIVETNSNMIFVQVSGRGDAYFQSDILPRAEGLAHQSEQFDPLQSVIEKAHQQGLQVHAWINIYFIWSAPIQPQSKKHVFHQHPEWMVYTDEGKSLLDYERPNKTGIEGVFLSPGHPGVQEWVANVIDEIVTRYDVDGIHLDYIRYPNSETDLNPETRIRFKQKYSIDPIQLFQKRDVVEGTFGVEEIVGLDSLWHQWRCQQVTETVQKIRRRIESIRPEVKLSAAVKPNYDLAVRRFGQDWREWAQDGLLDFIVVMAYSPNTDVVVQQIEAALHIVQGGYLFAGLGAYNQDVFKTIQQISEVRSLGIDGISIFSYNSIADNEEYFHSLKESSFQRVTAVPPMTTRSK